jgi:hypothetical protein
MKVDFGITHHITVTLDCGCQIKQEYSDASLAVASVPTPTFCKEHSHKQVRKAFEGLLLECLSKERTDRRASANLAIAQANATRGDVSETAPAQATYGVAPVGEGSASETKTPIKIPGVTPKPPARIPIVRQVNLATSPRAGVKRASSVSRASEVVAAKQVVSSTAAGDIELATEDPRVTKLLVDDDEGGLLGAHEDTTVP